MVPLFPGLAPGAESDPSRSGRITHGYLDQRVPEGRLHLARHVSGGTPDINKPKSRQGRL
ncbi:MAG: hypothetical protein K9N46_05885 [Candidatus Marinimicrobia bacterium]|nr:hypothetical protein [Candidatus Neomarinimicrobiota bacterium]MCF7880251.1 hypothetical protein [Candidatus Neomarinimicrobiota bacterium]